MNPAEHDALLRALYEVALGPDGWAAPLQQVARALDAGNFHLMVWSPQQAHPSFSLQRGMDAGMEAQYAAHYGAIDPRRLLVADMAEGDWLACDRRFDSRTVERSEFWQDYLIPGGCRYLLGTRLTQHAGSDIFFGLHRAPGQRPFDADDLALVHRITGHFQNAARLWLQTQQLREQAAFGERALDAVEYGVLGVSAQGHVVFSNRLGEALLRQGHPLRLRQGVLTAETPDDTQALAALLQQCRQTGQSRSLRVGDAGDTLCTVTVLALPRDGTAIDQVARAELLLLVSLGGRRRVLGAQQLMQIFGLTPAEARLARALAAGESLEAYGAATQVRMPTLRSQLKAVFEKTGTRRQSDLVRQLVVIPALRG